jgi:Arc/MetJ family transcription regulator
LALIETKLLLAKTVKQLKLRVKEGYVHKLVQRSLYEP